LSRGSAVLQERVEGEIVARATGSGASIGILLESFPAVTRAQVVAFLEQAKDRPVESIS
jgi:uncharacterized protein (DUF433 family)